jgi:c-di-GMP-binding flagellar brake protein YcgR
VKIDICTPEEIERFKIEHPAEIERILRGVMEKRALVTAYSENNRDFLVTTLVAVDPDQRAIYFGAGPKPAIDRALTVSEEVAFNTAHDQVRVIFVTPALSEVVLAGERVLRADMPKELLRFQRREYYRLPTPMTNPVKCLIGTGDAMVETIVLDLSIGGVGVLAYSRDVDLREGEVYQGCRLALPDAGNYVVSLRVRTVHDQPMKNGIVSRRLGCQFIDLPGSVETDIQRYIIRVERERRLGSL